MTCSCKRWDIDGIPYNHTMEAISFRLWDPYDFVEDWFKTSTYRATYNDCVPPLEAKSYGLQYQVNYVTPLELRTRRRPSGPADTYLLQSFSSYLAHRGPSCPAANRAAPPTLRLHLEGTSFICTFNFGLY
uniref:Zinc finger PMZ-type domain-containing protein n=1 Tax=Ananas comosus var. bracteatus TaxID=296719 RepID=A0A6V7NFC1_ANACO|nr:unnamed protein product [Ananas comosus var. bracteatus]